MRMNKEDIIHDKAQFVEIMKNLNGTITDAFIRVSNRKNAGILDSDLINMQLSDTPITIALRDDGNINIFDSGENNFVIEMDKFDYADISDMDKEDTFGFLEKPCNAVTIWLKTNVFVVLYYWTKEK